MIAVDASIALKLVLNEADSDRVRAKWQSWTDAGEAIVAPILFRYETLSVVRRKVHERKLTGEDGERAFGVLRSLAIQFREPDDLYEIAWQFAERFHRPTLYDCCYLALADIVGCDLWIADRRLANAVGASLPWVRTP